MIWDASLQQLFQVVLVERTESLGRDSIARSVRLLCDRCL